MEEAFVARPSGWRLALGLAGCLVFVLLGFWLAGLLGDARDPGSLWIGWLSILFFGACGVAILVRMRDRRDQIVVDRNGILWRQWSDTIIPWAAITAIDRRRIQGQSFLCLHLRDPSAYPSFRLLGRMAGLNRGIGFGDISISASGTDRKFVELEEAIGREFKAWLDRQGAQGR